LLRQWLGLRAKSSLQPWLKKVSTETGLVYHKVSVRAQKTRWGSCSNKKHINLNRALMFLPSELVRYLMIHELSHTVHLNHSRAFWTLVARWAPQYKHYETQLNQYSAQIPLWALP
jgi:predicted metal-dependent hydrolase